MKDEEAIKALVMAFDKAMNARDAAALSKVFNEDADFTNVIGMTDHGRKAIEEFHRPLFEDDGTKGMPSFRNAVFKVLDTPGFLGLQIRIACSATRSAMVATTARTRLPG